MIFSSIIGAICEKCYQNPWLTHVSNNPVEDPPVQQEELSRIPTLNQKLLLSKISITSSNTNSIAKSKKSTSNVGTLRKFYDRCSSSSASPCFDIGVRTLGICHMTSATRSVATD